MSGDTGWNKLSAAAATNQALSKHTITPSSPATFAPMCGSAYSPRKMTVKDIKLELVTLGSPCRPRWRRPITAGSKEDWWARLTAARCLAAKAEHEATPFGGPALEALVSTVFAKLPPSSGSALFKCLLTKELAAHIANFIELPKFFGVSTFRFNKNCTWKCKHICLCNVLAPPFPGHERRDARVGPAYQELQDAWAAARAEWEPTDIKLSQELVECAPSLCAVLPGDLCELIAEKITQSKHEDEHKILEFKKELVEMITVAINQENGCKQELMNTKARLARCGQAARRAAAKAGVEVKLSQRIQQNKKRAEGERDLADAAYGAAVGNSQHLKSCCKDTGVAWSPWLCVWVPI